MKTTLHIVKGIGLGAGLALWLATAAPMMPQLAQAQQVTAQESALDPTAARPWPARSVLPWRNLGVDRSRAAALGPALTAAVQQNRNAWLGGNGTPLATYAAPRALTRNQQRMLADVVVAPGDVPNGPWTITPVWCTAMNYDLLFLTVTASDSDLLLAAPHRAWQRDQWNGNGPNFAGQLTGALRQLWGEAQAQANQAARNPPADRLQVSLRLGHGSSRADVGSAHCLNLLVSGQAPGQFHWLHGSSGHLRVGIQRALGQPRQAKRAARIATLKWQAPPFDAAQPYALPAAYALQATMAEGVRGQPIPNKLAVTWNLSARGNQLQFPWPEEFNAWLEGERRGLRSADWPQIAAVDRAWVYLDRGRAWGLKMNDRLVADVGGEQVTGHVVRFYGPSFNLQSPRGFPIHEGAILYIRSGQHLTKPGVEFRFDPKQYPTPLP